MNQPIRGGGFRLPWWLIVGAIGFLIFGGWRGFFGAIFGVLLLPLALFASLAIVMIGFVLIKGKRVQVRHTHEEQRPVHDGKIVEAEAVVIERDQ